MMKKHMAFGRAITLTQIIKFQNTAEKLLLATVRVNKILTHCFSVNKKPRKMNVRIASYRIIYLCRPTVLVLVFIALLLNKKKITFD